MTDPIFITGLEITNHKRITALTLQLKPHGGLIAVCGKNDAGKSTAINAVWATVGGAEASPPRPIQNGKSQARTSVTLSNGLTATCIWDGKGRKLAVEIDGKTVRESPQTALNKLFGPLSFDPLAFQALKRDEQARRLRELVGLDVSDLEAKRAKLFTERADANKALKSAEARYGVAPHHEDVGTEPVSVSELTAALRIANETIRRNDAARAKVSALGQTAETKRARVVKLQNQIAELQAALEVAEQDRDAAVREYENQEKAAEGLTDPDTEALSRQIDAAEATNQKIRENQEHSKLAADVRITKARAQKLTEAIEDVDMERAARLEALKFPVDGLSLDGDEILFDGLPLSEAGRATQQTVCLEISAALNPLVRAIFIPEGGVYDEDGPAAIARWAKDRGYQVFMAIPRKTIEGEGILIVDGKVAEERFEDDEAEALAAP